MPTAFVTGGTGFVGTNLVIELRRRGWDVTAVHRVSSELKYLRPTGASLVVGDATDRASLALAMPEAVDAVFHVAANTSLWRGGDAAQTRTNVDGTRNLVEVALAKRARRFVHTSSVAAYGRHDGVLAAEQTPSNAAGMWINYCRTKWLAEEEVRAGVAKGLDAVIVNPANILGPYDFGGWSRMFVLLQQNRLPGVPPGSGPWCHVRDVVAGHLAAYERGRRGENYILAGPDCSYRDVMVQVSQLLGRKPPRAIPALIMKIVGRVGQLKSAFTKRAPDVTPEIALMLSSTFRFSSAKAERELGYRIGDVAEMIKDTHAWLVADGRI